jgi:hypothetical protein
LLGGAGLGLGAIALDALTRRETARAAPARHDPLAPKRPMHAAKAKAVIYLHMAGAPSQLDLFDWKPELRKLSGKPCPKSLYEGKRFAFLRGEPTMLGSSYRFARHGKSGAELSELLPRFAEVVDDVAFVKSMRTDEFNHAPAQLFALTGTARFGGAALGSWVTYGLGAQSEDLPGFVVLLSGAKTPDAGKSLWGSGFLPSVFQGVQCRSRGEPVLFASDPAGLDRTGRRETLDALRALNQLELDAVGDPETATRIAQYELAYRMQASVPEVMDISREPRHVLDLYGAVPGFHSDAEGAEDPRTLYKGTDATFANNCLLARRLVERGVRFVQLFDWGWDHHGISPGESIDQTLPIKAQQIDRAMTGLLKDLKQRSLLDDVLVVWGGEFGRTPMQQNASTQAFIGRDHHVDAFTVWLAGGGIKGGQTIGETDELGYHVVRDEAHVRDLQATILHLMGLDPFRLTYPFQGLDQRLIGPEGKAKVLRRLLA